jgi:hypothetical protein
MYCFSATPAAFEIMTTGPMSGLLEEKPMPSGLTVAEESYM